MRRFAMLLTLTAACAGDPAPAPAAAPPAPAPAPAPVPPATPASASSAAAAGDAEAGKAVYTQYCVPCHQADGSGMNGMLAANFKADKSRLAKSDDELLKSIREGYQGKVGQMPPWGSTLNDQQMRDVLGYVRATFGN
jgi:mono/diheme cytochrome c family protein